MVTVGIVKKTRIDKNRKGGESVRLVEVQISDPEDVQTVELFTRAGDDYNPPVGSQILVVFPSTQWAIAIGFQDGVDPEALEGEKFLYSVSEIGAVAAIIKLLKTGVIELNGNTVGVARLNDTIQANVTTDPAFLGPAGWVTAVHAALGLPGSAPVIINGAITSASADVVTD